MALFHLSVTQTKRSAGQSAIASAAYRAGERLYSEYYGEYSDYTRKGGVICSDILLPSHAPPEYADRQTLARCTRGAVRRSAFRGKTSRRPGSAQKTLLPRTVSTSASPAHSASASIGARCPIVKDLSRFARNYSDAGSLIDNLFVQMGVRFISLAENVDSYKNPDSVSNIIVPITNVMNDNYCYQTSKKIRQVFDYKRRNGQYIGAFAPYGYVKHPKDKHRLIVDPDAAENVKLIFTMLIQGSSKRAIALYLNEHGVPSPSAYKVQKGLPVSTRGYDDPMWGVRMIHSILTNPTYTGDLAQGRSRVKSYKVHQIEAVPREEWVEVAGTHEAIIDYETFDKVQALLQRDTRTSPKGREVHLFSGFLKCADCGRAITRCVGKNNNVYYSCSTYKNRSRTACTMHSIKHERLEAAVLFAVQHQVHLAVSYSEIVTQINSAPIKKSQSYRLDDLIAAKERELTKITRYKQSLYQDWKDGEITQQEYAALSAAARNLRLSAMTSSQRAAENLAICASSAGSPIDSCSRR